jgi:hypothetical protein
MQEKETLSRRRREKGKWEGEPGGEGGNENNRGCIFEGAGHANEKKVNGKLIEVGRNEFERKYAKFVKAKVCSCAGDNVSFNDKSLFAPVLQCP